VIPVFLFFGCINETIKFKRVDIVGTAIPHNDTDTGSLNIIAYHAQYGSGVLEYSFHEFSRTQSDSLEFDWNLDIPQKNGEGLALRAWLDRNDDGKFCTPDARDEHGGTTVIEEVDWIIEVDIELIDICDF
jgi:hypothetical protein